MDTDRRTQLQEAVRVGGYAYVRNLAAAEAAVERGQFNVAKVLRAVAHAQYTRARDAARLLATDLDPALLFTAILDELPALGVAAADPALAAREAHDAAVGAGVADLLRRAGASLATNSDVLESDVAQFIWACHGCGQLTEGDEPGSCAVCGARAPEFRPFGPFYAVTPEHLGQRTPAEIVAILAAVPASLAEALGGVDEATLARKPSPEEWSIKEIVAHILETDLLFASRVRSIIGQDAGSVPRIDAAIPPWLLHEGKGYAAMPTRAILEQLGRVREESLTLIRAVTPDQWGWWGINGKEGTTVLDLGTWLANHDQGHLAQIRRMCQLPA